MRIIQIIATTAAATGAIVGAVKFFMKHIDNRLENKIDDHKIELNKRMDEQDNKITLLRVSVDFFEKYFIEPLKLKGYKEREKEEDD